MPKLYADTTARRTVQIVSDVFVVCWVALSSGSDEPLTTGSPSCADRSTTSPRRRLHPRQHGRRRRQRRRGPLVGDSLRGPFDADLVGGSDPRRHRDVPRHDRRPGVPHGRNPHRRRPDRHRPRGLGGPADPFHPPRDRRPALVEPSRSARAVRAPGPDPQRPGRLGSGDPAGGFRRGDPAALDALAALELRACGLAPRPGEGWPAAARSELSRGSACGR